MAASISSHVPSSESWEVKEKMKTSDLCSESQDAEKQNEERAEKMQLKNWPSSESGGAETNNDEAHASGSDLQRQSRLESGEN